MASTIPDVSFNFAGKRALVTGAGQGIGRAIAIALSQAGAETYALSKTKQNLDSLVKQCPSIHPVCVNLADWTATRQAVEALPPIDLLVNNAAIFMSESFLDAKPEDFDRLFAVNLKAVMNVSQVVAKSLTARGSPGSIVNVSSLTSIRAGPGLSVYSSTKGGLDQLTRVMALELGPQKIRVNSVNPQTVLTEMARAFCNDPRAAVAKARIPLRRFAETSEMIGPALFLLSDAASMINGAILMVDGGSTVT